MATPNIVPRADQEGGLGTAAKSWGKLFIENAAAGGTAAATISNLDVDQNALKISAANTTAAVFNITAQDLTTAKAIYVDCNSLTSGSALVLDIDDALTTSATKSLALIDYDKSGVTASGQSSITTGLEISMIDAASNNASGTVANTGVDVTIDAAAADGTISQTGFSATLTDGDTARTTGYFSNVENGGLDFKAVSSVNLADYCTIAVTTNGATTITTVDGDAALAHFEIAADGNITLDAAGDIALEAEGNDITVDSNTFTITATDADYPQIKLLNTTDDNQASQLIFDKLRADDGVATGQNLGEIWFNGQDGSQNAQSYAYIVGEIDVSTHGQESGQLALGVASHDGTNQTGLTLTGGSVSGEVDAAIGKGAASLVSSEGSIAGTNYRTLWVDAGSMVPQVTNGAAAGTSESADAYDIMNDYFAFDTSTDEYVQFKIVMPEQWDAGTVKAKFYWKPASSTDTNHDVVWSIQGQAHDDGGELGAWGTAASAAADNVIATDSPKKVHITAASGACTIAGSPVAGSDEIVYFRIYRDVSADDLNEDAHLLGVLIQYREHAVAKASW